MTHNNYESSEKDELWQRFHRHGNDDPFDKHDRMFKIRQLLNVFFILLTIAGIAVWYAVSPGMGSYILIGGVAFKFIELSMRIMKF